jgi:pimeloyl-ACP methyl ester carboxylesterase
MTGSCGLAACHLPELAAGGLLYPRRHTILPPRPANCEERVLAGEDVRLLGWHCRAEGTRRGTVIYLHGTADNRGSAVGVIRRFTTAGLDVVAYDSRRHGSSGGDVCTYGYFEKADLRRVIDTLSPGPVVLFGTSLGAAVALQEAAADRRVTAIIAVEVFSDLRTIARERAPAFLSNSTIDKAFRIAKARGRFRVEDVSPVKAARSIEVPVLLIHGAEDRDTPPNHSERVLAALAGPKRLFSSSGSVTTVR